MHLKHRKCIQSTQKTGGLNNNTWALYFLTVYAFHTGHVVEMNAAALRTQFCDLILLGGGLTRAAYLDAASSWTTLSSRERETLGPTFHDKQEAMICWSWSLSHVGQIIAEEVYKVGYMFVFREPVPAACCLNFERKCCPGLS